jgi:hypothetical protein
MQSAAPLCPAKLLHRFGNPASRPAIDGFAQYAAHLSADFGYIDALLAVCAVHGHNNLASA